MTSPLRLCVRRSSSPERGAATLVTLRLPSDVTCIEEAVELVTRHCLAGHDTSPTTRFRLRVVLSEALSNAILRGNAEDHKKWVEVRAELVPESIRVYVTDEGNWIMDCTFAPIQDLQRLSDRLARRAGIMDHGLFIGLATDLLVAGANGVEHRTAP